jgi:hypothetical protein
MLPVVALLTAIGCGGTSPVSPSDIEKGTAGTFNVRLTDNPFDSARAVLITFSEVSVQRNGNWTKVPFPDSGASAWTCDLKKLENGNDDLLATAVFPIADFTAVRLIVQSATVYTDNPATSSTPCARSIAAPAGAASPMTILATEASTNGAFSVRGGGTTTVLLDLDGDASITRPNPSDYRLDPQLRLVSVQ